VKDVFHFKKVAWDCPEGSPETFSQEVITPTQLRSHLHIVIHNQAAQEEPEEKIHSFSRINQSAKETTPPLSDLNFKIYAVIR
jgi:hypothetical protein